MKHLFIILSLVIASCGNTTAPKTTAPTTPKEAASDCGFEDGTYSAVVAYHNPKTNYSHDYTLDVEVSDCEVVTIFFPSGGWLDNDHIRPAELAEDGTATVYGDEGRTYGISISQ